MKIYVCHSTAFDYHNDLYLPLKNSILNQIHSFVFPHQIQNEPTNSKNLILSCDLVLAEVTFPSTGVGIELAWAETAGIQILCIYRENSHFSSSLKIICSKFMSYVHSEDIVNLLKIELTLKE